MSLRRRILALIALLLVASLIGGGILTYWQGVQRIELEMSSALRVGDNAIRDAVMPLRAGPVSEGQLERLVSSFDGDRHLRAKLISADGRTLRESHVLEPSHPAPQWLYRLLTAPPHSVDVTLPQYSGKIVLAVDPLNEVSEVWDDAKLKLGLMGGFCILVLAMISFTLGRALKPLEDFSRALQRVGGGDYAAHVSETGPQELAAIYKGFNLMAAKLADAEHQNGQLNEQLSTVQDEERAEIARDLHDEVGPFLFAVDVDAQTIQPLLARDARDEVVARAAAIRQSVVHMQTHLRSIMSRLRPSMLIDLGLAHAADQLAEFWRARYSNIVFDIDCANESFGIKLDEAAFRILQEGTNNAIRHGKPSRISLMSRRIDGDVLLVSVSDDGHGIRDSGHTGFGLQGMRDRLALLGGWISVDTGLDGRGVSLTARIPIRDPLAGGPPGALPGGLPGGRQRHAADVP